MSSFVFPSPVPLSGSSLGRAGSTKVGPEPASATVTVALISTMRWLGGQSTVGVTDTLMTGGVVSATVTEVPQVPALLLSSVAVKVTGVTPSGKNGGASLVITGLGSQLSLADAPLKNG